MKDKRSIEEQVAELTEQQKETILKVDKYGMILMLVLTAPGLLLMCAGLFFAISTATVMTAERYAQFRILGAVIVVISLLVFLFIRIKFPYYSDKKCAYIRKQRKLAEKAAEPSSEEA